MERRNSSLAFIQTAGSVIARIPNKAMILAALIIPFSPIPEPELAVVRQWWFGTPTGRQAVENMMVGTMWHTSPMSKDPELLEAFIGRIPS